MTAPEAPRNPIPNLAGDVALPDRDVALPFAPIELRAVLQSPARVLDVVLGEHRRLSASIAAGESLAPLLAILLACTLVATLPYGLMRGWWTAFSIAVLYGGTVLMCWPSLQVFSTYLGGDWRPLQSLTMAMLVAAVGALFTLGFAPIVWFLRATMRQGDLIDGDAAYLALLAFGLFAGLGQLNRCLADADALRRVRSSLYLIAPWQLLVAFVAWRMARALGITG